MFLEAQNQSSGLAKRARFSMSHVTGKIEVAGLTESQIIFRYHRAADPKNIGRTMVFRRDGAAHWFDDYEEAAPFQPSRSAGSELPVLQTAASRC